MFDLIALEKVIDILEISGQSMLAVDSSDEEGILRGINRWFELYALADMIHLRLSKCH